MCCVCLCVCVRFLAEEGSTVWVFDSRALVAVLTDGCVCDQSQWLSDRVSVNHFRHLTHVTPVWKISITITDTCLYVDPQVVCSWPMTDNDKKLLPPSNTHNTKQIKPAWKKLFWCCVTDWKCSRKIILAYKLESHDQPAKTFTKAFKNVAYIIHNNMITDNDTCM